MKAVRVLTMLACLASSTVLAEPRIASINQGTGIALDLSPDGQTLVFDLLGGLWQLPIGGGGATSLVEIAEEARHPRFSPDGTRLVYQRRIDGQWDLWMLSLADGSRTALTATPHIDEREPDFLPDGQGVVFSSDRTGTFSLWSLDLGTEALAQLTADAGDSYFPTVSDSGAIAYVNRKGREWSLRVHEGGPRGRIIWTGDHAVSAPSWRPGNGVVLFQEHSPAGSTLNLLLTAGSEEPVLKALTAGEDVFAGRAAWRSSGDYIYAADGGIWRRGIASASREPIYLFAALTIDATGIEAFEVPLDAPGPHRASGTAGWDTSADGTRQSFVALGDLWLSEGGRTTRLTDDAHAEADPVFTPAGDAVVFASDRSGRMALWRIDLESRALTQLTRGEGKAYRPAIDPKGERLAYLETAGFGPWSRTSLMVTSLAAGSAARSTVVADDLYDVGPVRWTADEPQRLAVWGRTDSEPQQWQSFMPDGTRSFVAPPYGDPAPPSPGPLPDDPALSWSPIGTEQPYVIQVGRLFDGVRNDYRRHVDIHVEGQRISAVVARGERPLPARVVDARDDTVIPGLIDLHAHQSALLGSRLGAAWLANGVTTVRELSSNLGASLERAEAWASGRRIGPRLVVSADPGAVPGIEPQAIVLRPQRPQDMAVGHDALEQWWEMGLSSGNSALERLSRSGRPSGAEFRISPMSRSYQDVGATAAAASAYIYSTLAPLAAAGLVSGQLERFFTPGEIDIWRSAGPAAGRDVDALSRTLAQLVRSGVRVVAASDAPAVPYGFGLHAELGLLARAGLPPDQVLRLATAEAALALGLDRQLGTVEAGKIADMVVLSGDPLRRIEETTRIRGVVAGGVWRPRESLQGRL